VSHPHPDRRHVMVAYRRYILGCKKKFGTARSQVHYRDLVDEYLAAKRDVIAERNSNPAADAAQGGK
jgi:hypothetical protein